MKRKTKVIIGVVIAALAVFLGYLAYLHFVTFGPDIPRKYKSYIKYAYGDDVKISKPEREKSDDGKQGSTVWDFSFKDKYGHEHHDCFSSWYERGKSKEVEPEFLWNLISTARFARDTVVCGQLYDSTFKDYFPAEKGKLEEKAADYSSLSYVNIECGDCKFSLLCNDRKLSDTLHDLEKNKDTEGLKKYLSDKNGIKVWDASSEEYFKEDESRCLYYDLTFPDKKTAEENIGKMKDIEKELNKNHPEIPNYALRIFYTVEVEEDDGYTHDDYKTLYESGVIKGEKVKLKKGESYSEKFEKTFGF